MLVNEKTEITGVTIHLSKNEAGTLMYILNNYDFHYKLQKSLWQGIDATRLKAHYLCADLGDKLATILKKDIKEED